MNASQAGQTERHPKSEETYRKLLKRAPGDLIEVHKGIYSHWAVHIGNGELVHYSAQDDQAKGRVTRSDFWEVVETFRAFINNYRDDQDSPRSPEDIKAEALRRLNEAEYSLIFNNCEHFATSCRYGNSSSEQVSQAAKVLYPGPIPGLQSPVSLPFPASALNFLTNRFMRSLQE